VATHDYVIANGTGAAVRSDLNGALAAIVSNNSSATEPATMYAYMWWPDTTTGLLKQRNAANSAWITIGTLASANLGLLSLAGGTMTGVLAVTAGTAALPGIAVSGDLNTGITSPGADQIAISTGGTSRLAVSTTAVSSTLAVDHPLGAVGTPSITFTGDLNTGIYSPGADTVALATGGANRVHVTSGGLVGIGTTGPGALLHLNGGTSADQLRLGTDSSFYKLGRNSVNGPFEFYGTQAGVTGYVFSGVDGERARIDTSGRLLVGTSSGNANGGILQLSSGITFPATAVAASDANTLDDYEEGTFTATVQGSTTSGTATYTTQTAQYTKIGNRVLFNLRIIYTGGTGTGNLRVGGLPFTSSSSMAGAVTNVIAENITGTALYVFVGLVGVNTTYVGIDQLPTGGGAGIATAYDAAGDISIAGQYFV
jgi:hypothetical protein